MQDPQTGEFRHESQTPAAVSYGAGLEAELQGDLSRAGALFVHALTLIDTGRSPPAPNLLATILRALDQVSSCLGRPDRADDYRDRLLLLQPDPADLDHAAPATPDRHVPLVTERPAGGEPA